MFPGFLCFEKITIYFINFHGFIVVLFLATIIIKSDVLFQGEYNSLLLKGITDLVSRQEVEKEFTIFGKVVEVIKFRSGSFYWGKLVYSKSSEANKAVRR